MHTNFRDLKSIAQTFDGHNFATCFHDIIEKLHLACKNFLFGDNKFFKISHSSQSWILSIRERLFARMFMYFMVCEIYFVIMFMITITILKSGFDVMLFSWFSDMFCKVLTFCQLFYNSYHHNDRFSIDWIPSNPPNLQRRGHVYPFSNISNLFQSSVFYWVTPRA